MAQLNRVVTVQGPRVLYAVSVRDNAPDVEFDSFDFEIVGNSTGLSTDTVEEAIRTFANAIAAASETYSVQSITKTSVTEANLSL